MSQKNKSNYSPYTERQKSGPRTTLGTHKRPTQIHSIDEANDRLYDLFKNHGGSFISHELRQKLAQFYVLLMENQERENFTRLLTLKDIGIKHFLDCLIMTQLTKLQFPLLDLGTGPGLPGIPLKLMYAKEKILLAEGVQKRVVFLKHVREKMQLQNLDIIGRNINPSFVIPVRGVITRAVEDLTNTLTNVMFCLEDGGKVYFMKGPNVDPEIQLVPTDLLQYYQLTEDHAYSLEKTPHQRRLVVYTKIKTPPLPDNFDEYNLFDKDDHED